MTELYSLLREEKDNREKKDKFFGINREENYNPCEHEIIITPTLSRCLIKHPKDNPKFYCEYRRQYSGSIPYCVRRRRLNESKLIFSSDNDKMLERARTKELADKFVREHPDVEIGRGV